MTQVAQCWLSARVINYSRKGQDRKCPAVKMGSSQRATIAIPVEWIEAQKQP